MILRPQQIHLLRMGLPPNPYNGGDAAPAPDPAAGIAALKSAELGEKWFDFAQNVYKESQPRQAQMDALTTKIAEQGLSTAQFNDEQARTLWDRYQTRVAPMEDAYFKEARDYDSEDRQNQAAGQAGTDIQAQIDAAKEANLRTMARAGVNPADGRYQQTMNDMATTGALAKASAMTGARQNVRDQGIMLRQNAIAMGKGLPVLAGSTFGAGQNAGQAGVSALGMGGNMVAQRAGIMTSGMQGAMGGYGQQANILNADYNNRVNAWNASNQSDAGLWGAAGALGGALILASDRRLKKNIRQVGALKNGLPLYEYEYAWGGRRRIGVMADDVEALIPDAVITHKSGYKLVDYSKLGSMQ